MHTSDSASLSLAIMAASVIPAAPTVAQNYPSKPIRIIVSSAPGGSPDIAARTLASQLALQMGQQLVVDNRTGASGIIGYEALTRAMPDGYTFGYISFLVATNPAMYLKLPYDFGRDFKPVIISGSTPNVVVVNPTLPVRSVRELIDHARSNPGKLSYGSSGVGASPHLAMEMFAAMTGSTLVHVAYKGTQQAITDLVAGQIHILCDNISPLLPMIKSGRLRGLGVTSLKRSDVLADLPTLDEAGLPGYELAPWGGYAVPAGVPRNIVLRLNAEINKALVTPELAKSIAERGGISIGGTPDFAADFVRRETEKWAKVIKTAGIKPQ
jgi:tripartite-type tricarboxylate transporter receptor subunit TctC